MKMLSKMHFLWTKLVCVGCIHEGKNNYNLLAKVLEVILHVDLKTKLNWFVVGNKIVFPWFWYECL